MKSKKCRPTSAGEEDDLACASSADIPSRHNSVRDFVQRRMAERDIRALTSSMKGVFSRRASGGDALGQVSATSGGIREDSTAEQKDKAADIVVAGRQKGSHEEDSLCVADGDMLKTLSVGVAAAQTPLTGTLMPVCQAPSSSSKTAAESEEMSSLGAECESETDLATAGILDRKYSDTKPPEGKAQGAEEGAGEPLSSQPEPEPSAAPAPHSECQDAEAVQLIGKAEVVVDREGERLASLVGVGGEQVVRSLEKSASFLAAAAGGAAASLTSLIVSSPSNRPTRRAMSATAEERKPSSAQRKTRISEADGGRHGSSADGAEEASQPLDGATLSKYDGSETLSRNHPVFEMIRQRSHLSRASSEAGESRRESNPTPEASASSFSTSSPVLIHSSFTEASCASGGQECPPRSNLQEPATGTWKARGKEEGGPQELSSPFTTRRKTDYQYDYVDKLILKFTTYSQDKEHSAFVIGKGGGSIGRDVKNTVSVPSDSTLQEDSHAFIGFKAGSFYIKNLGVTHCAAIRVGAEPVVRDWPLVRGATFSAGNSIFLVVEITPTEMVAEVIDGPLKGERLKVSQKGATLGRSPDNTLSIADPELSRRHSRIEYEEKDGKYYLSDVGSTNGTYMQLAGPYAKAYNLSLGDEIMVGRTGFSINRYDYGISEERGRRKTMEDHTLVIQDLGVRALKRFGLAPQTFAAVFDGHGGEEASAYLACHLHVNLREELERRFGAIEGDGRIESQELDAIVKGVVLEAFDKTDQDFLGRSNVDAGSTATTVLIMGRRVYSCNVGDSRTIICRDQKLLLCSNDHKPARVDEARRIRQAGGFIFQNRVMGELAVSRAFGDRELKKCMQEIMAPDELEQMSLRDARSDGDEALVKDYSQPLVIARPEILITELSERDDFVLLACDGLFDVFPNSEVVRFILEDMKQHHDAQRACENISYTAIHQRIAHDNVSIVLLVTNNWW